MTLISCWPHPAKMLSSFSYSSVFFLALSLSLFLFLPFPLFILFYVRLFWKTFVSCFCLLNKSCAHSLFSRSYHFLQVHPWTYRVPPWTACLSSSILSSFLIAPAGSHSTKSLSFFFNFFFFVFSSLFSCSLLRCHTLGRAERKLARRLSIVRHQWS